MNKKMLFSAAFIAALTLTAQAEQVAPCISSVGYAGDYPGFYSYDADTDTYTVNGCGADIWGSNDAFTYVYAIENVSADFDYLAKFENFTSDSSEWAKAGLMVRECSVEDDYDDQGNPISYGQDAASRYFFIQSLRSNAAAGETRWIAAWRPEYALGVTDSYCARYGSYTYPSWLRIRRIGDTFYGYVSTDGASWTLIAYQDTANEDKGYVQPGTTPWSAPLGLGEDNLAIGIAVTSHDASSTAAVATVSGFQKFPQTPATFVTEPQDIEVTAGTEYTLNTQFAGYNPFTYTLKKGNTVIAEGSTMGYTASIDLGALAVADAGSYTLEISNTVDGAKKTASKTFQISVVEDTVAPSVASIRALGNEIGVTFSEAVTADSATKAAAYAVAGNTVASVKQTSATRVVLTLGKAISANTEVTFSGIKDFSGNEFNGTATAIAYKLSNSGKASAPGTAFLNGGDALTINNWGMDYWYNYGEDTLVYKEVTGDFDIQARLTDMPLGAKYSRGGISARVNLDEGTTSGHGAFVAINQFPMNYILWDADSASFGEPISNVQGFDDYRQAVQLNWRPSTTESTTGDGAAFTATFNGATGTFGNNPGKTYIRLVRLGNTFYSYYSTDNKASWVAKSAYTLANAPAKMYVGQHFAVEGYQFNTDTPDSLKEWIKNPDITFSASWEDYNEGYLQAVAFTSQPVSQSLQANASLTLQVTATGDPLQYQWYKDGIALEESVAVQGTKTATLYLPYTAATDSGSYTCRIFNLAGDMATSEAISDVALVSISGESEAPVLVDCGYDFNTKNLYALFNEGMDLASLTDKTNYSITDKNGTAVAITDLIPGANGTYVSIVANGLIQGEDYIFAISGLKDRSLNALPDTEPVEFAVTYSEPVTSLRYEKEIRGADINEFVEIVRNNVVNPSSVFDMTGFSNFEYSAEASDNFSVAITGYIIAPETGNYRFATASDDQSYFYLSTDNTVAGLSEVPVCKQADWNEFRIYTKNQYQQSADIYLEAGKYYYFEYYFWEATGGENFALAWSLPSQGPAQITDGTLGIPMEYVCWVINPSHTVLEIVEQPTKIEAIDMNPYSIPVIFNSSSDKGRTLPTYTWYINNNNTGGQWQTVADYTTTFSAGFSGYDTPTLNCAKIYEGIQDGTFRVTATLCGREITSNDIIVEVKGDSEAPIGYPKGSNTMEEVIISFSEPVTGADDMYAYEIPGLDIYDISVKYSELEGDIELVALKTSRQEEGKVYTVKFNGIYDAYWNEIEPTAQFTAFVWVSGFSVLECFDRANDYADLYETIYWNDAASPYRTGALHQSPLLGNALEIYTTTFNQDYCVERISGYIVPQESGNYTFTGSVDDRYKMWISEDESISNIDIERVVSYETAWNSSGERQWNWEGCTGEYGTIPVYLEAGKKYFYVASLQEDGGGDFLTITWTKEGNQVQPNKTAPILCGDLIGCYVNPDSATVTFTKQPVDASAKAGESVTFSADATTVNDYSQTVSYQWYVGDKAIAGATGRSVTLVAGIDLVNVPVYCSASVPGKTVNSDFVYIDVEIDEVAATPISLTGSGKSIVILFDKPILAGSIDAANFSIVGATVKDAALYTYDSTDSSVILTAEGCSGNVITVQVSGVKSKSGVAMPETVTIQGGYLPLTQTNVYANGATSGVGAIGMLGHAIVYPDSVDMYASGYDVDGTGDACFFMYEEVEGDFDIVIRAEVNDANAYQWSKVGLMFRASLNYDSPQLNVLANYNSTYNTQRRFTTGGGTGNSWPQPKSDGTLALVDPQNSGSVFYPDNWIRLKREGKRFYAYRATSSEEPTSWTLLNYGDFNGTVDGTDCTLPNKGYVGIFATSHDVNVLGYYKVSGINLNYVYDPKSDETDFVGQDILKNGEQPGQPGSFVYDAESDVYTLTGSGADVRANSDGCYFVSQLAPEGDFQIVARVLDNRGSTTTWIKSGLMVRESDANGNLNGDARIFGTHTQRYDVTDGSSTASPWTLWRNAIGANIDDNTGGYYPYYPTKYPMWHRITKFGSILTGWVSYAEEPEESDWLLLEEVDTAEWADGALGSTLPLYVGMWVTANSSTSNDAHAKFANVAISEYVGLSHDETDFIGQDILKNGEQPARNGRFYYNEETDTYVIIGSGNDVRGGSDGCYYAYQPAPEGNFQIVAKLTKNIGATTTWIKSGLMLREGNDEGELIGNARIFGTHTQRLDQTSGANGSPWTLWRNALSADINDSTGGYHGEYPVQYPNWQRITKVGSVVSGWISYAEEPTDADWLLLEEVDTDTWTDGALGSTLPLYVGMWVTANSTVSNNARAEFANVSISNYSPAPVEDIVLNYEVTADTIILKWAASAQAGLEVAPTATGDWTVLNPEEIKIVDGVCTYEFPLSDANSFFRLAR